MYIGADLVKQVLDLIFEFLICQNIKWGSRPIDYFNRGAWDIRSEIGCPYCQRLPLLFLVYHQVFYNCFKKISNFPFYHIVNAIKDQHPKRNNGLNEVVAHADG